MNTINEDVVCQVKHNVNIVIGRQIMLLRKSQGLSGQALAKKLGISQQQVSRYERGICKIDVNMLIIVLIYLGSSLEHFFQKVLLSLEEQAPHIYQYYHSVFKLEFNINKECNNHHLIKYEMV